MASPNSAFTDIITTTLQGYSGKLADNVSKSNALLMKLSANGNKKTATGRSIVQELEYGENGTVGWYSGKDKLDISESETFTAAEFAYKQLAGNVVVDGLEQIQNSGAEAVFNLVRSRIKNLNKTMQNKVGAAVYADGTGSNGKEVGGLQLLVSDAGTGTVGNIDAGSYDFWKNYVYDFSNNSATASKDTITHAMNLAWVNTSRGVDKPDIIPADQNYYLFYLESLQPNMRFTDNAMADAGFNNVKFMSAPVIYDSQCPSNHMYFLNSDYIFLRPAKGREFVPLGEKSSTDQDAIVMPVVWAGNMTCSNRALQGVLVA